MKARIIRTSVPSADLQVITQEETFVVAPVTYRSVVHYDSSYPTQSYARCTRVDNGEILTTMHPQYEAHLDLGPASLFSAGRPHWSPFTFIFSEFRRVAEAITEPVTPRGADLDTQRLAVLTELKARGVMAEDEHTGGGCMAIAVYTDKDHQANKQWQWLFGNMDGNWGYDRYDWATGEFIEDDVDATYMPRQAVSSVEKIVGWIMGTVEASA